MIPPRPHLMNRGPFLKGESSGPFSFFRWAGLKQRLISIPVLAKCHLMANYKAYFGNWQIRHESGPIMGKKGGGVVLVSPYYGSDHLLCWFIDYHRKLGVEEFVFLDLSTQGDLSAKLTGQSDCAVWRPHGVSAPIPSLHGLNVLRWRYATGRWCLSLQPDERFVFFRSETRRINDLIDFLESEHRGHIYALTLEMYGERAAETLELRDGEDPLSLLPYFDPMGYAIAEDTGIVRGGVQRRTLFNKAPRHSPALNRIPLVKWGRNCAYIAGTRLLLPHRLNEPHPPWHTSPTACVLSFAQLESASALAVAARAEVEDIIKDGPPGNFDGMIRLREFVQKTTCSARYTATSDLVESGLLNPGQWF
jgi:hypothetical protein